METRQLTIRGHGGRPVPHRFLAQGRDTTHLAVVLPGLGYTCDMPLLYYTVSLLLDCGADVLQVEYTYGQESEYRSLSPDDRTHRLIADAGAACHAALGQRAYRRATLVGKSLGTRAMPHLLADELGPLATRSIWYTPLLNEERVRMHLCDARQPTLVAIGTDDPHYSAATVAAIRGEVVVIEGADHGMEIAGDIVRSVQALEGVMRAVQRFVADV